MGYRLGVDLGTTYTAAAVLSEDGPEMLGLGNRALQVPSVLFMRADGEVLVGEAAERRGATEPTRLVREFKRRVGDPVPLVVGGSAYSAQSLVARLLRWVVDAATEHRGEPPEHVTVTHPANWGPFKRDLMRQAAVLADLPDADLCTEPEAAAVTYAWRNRVAAGERVAVYDLGGGTFDAAVLLRGEPAPDGEAAFVLLGTPEGVEHLGGIDFDEAVFRHVLTSLHGSAPDLDPDGEATAVSLARLRRDCVEAKEALSADTETVVPVVLPGVNTSVRLTRGEFEEMLRPSITETVAAMRRVLRSSGTAPEELAAIVLVGGSSRIPLVSQSLSAAFGRPLALDTHPKHDVALGAALRGAPVPVAPTGPARAAARTAASGVPAPAAPPAPASPPAPQVPPQAPPQVRPTVPAAAASTAVPPAPTVAMPVVADPTEPLDLRPTGPPPGPPAGPLPAGGDLPEGRPERRGRPAPWMLAAAGTALVAAVVTLAVARPWSTGSTGRGSAGGGTSAASDPTSGATRGGQPSATVSGGSSPSAATSPPATSPAGLPAGRPLPEDVIVVPRRAGGNWDVVRITDTGGQETPLTGSRFNDGFPIVSTDRRTVVYVRRTQDGAQRSELRAVSVEGTGDRSLFRAAPAGCENVSRPAWHGDRLVLACTVDPESMRTDLKVVALDGKVLRTLDSGVLSDPAFSADGRTVVYWRNATGSAENGGRIMRVPVDRSARPAPVTDGRDNDPDVSPVADVLVFTRMERGIHTVDLDGGTPRRLTTGREDMDPSWSPDGRRIAFRRSGQLWVMNADGSGQRRVRTGGDNDRAAAWSQR